MIIISPHLNHYDIPYVSMKQQQVEWRRLWLTVSFSTHLCIPLHVYNYHYVIEQQMRFVYSQLHQMAWIFLFHFLIYAHIQNCLNIPLLYSQPFYSNPILIYQLHEPTNHYGSIITWTYIRIQMQQNTMYLQIYLRKFHTQCIQQKIHILTNMF